MKSVICGVMGCRYFIRKGNNTIEGAETTEGTKTRESTKNTKFPKISEGTKTSKVIIARYITNNKVVIFRHLGSNGETI